MGFKISFRSSKDGSPFFTDSKDIREEYIRSYYENPINRKYNLGQLFVEFLSLTKEEIEKGEHPFLLVDEHARENMTEDSFFFTDLKEYVDLGIENPNFFNDHCFTFFLELRGLHIPAMYQELHLKKEYENDAVENHIEYDRSMSSLERAMRGFVAAGSELYEIPFTTFDCETAEDACIASLYYLINHGCTIKKCKNCGKYFIPLRSDGEYCDRISPFNKRRTCKVDGAQRAHIQNTSEDDLDSLIKSIRDARYMRQRRNPADMDMANEYYRWMSQLNEHKSLYKDGAITKEQFIAWLNETKRYQKNKAQD